MLKRLKIWGGDGLYALGAAGLFYSVANQKVEPLPSLSFQLSLVVMVLGVICWAVAIVRQ